MVRTDGIHLVRKLNLTNFSGNAVLSLPRQIEASETALPIDPGYHLIYVLLRRFQEEVCYRTNLKLRHLPTDKVLSHRNSSEHYILCAITKSASVRGPPDPCSGDYCAISCYDRRLSPFSWRAVHSKRITCPLVFLRHGTSRFPV